MTAALLAACLLMGMGLAYTVGLRRSLVLAASGAGPRRMHSLPEHHGLLVALWCGLPAVVVALGWTALEGPLVGALVRSELPAAWRDLPAGERSLMMNEIANVAAGNVMAEVSPAILHAAERLNRLRETSSFGMIAGVLSLGLGGGVLAYRRMRPDLRARAQLESVLVVALALGSSIAILTTLGIVLSALFEALRFFQTVPLSEFLFGLEVFQKPNPFPKSVYDNVAYGPRIHGLVRTKGDTDRLVEQSLIRAGLFDEVKDRLRAPGTSLSGGQQQRLCIARAIAVQPEVILMDEPCSALDPIATAKVEQLIDELRNSYTIVVVTHSMQQAARVSQRTAHFHMGRLVEVGPTGRLFKNPRHQLTIDYITGRFG